MSEISQDHTANSGAESDTQNEPSFFDQPEGTDWLAAYVIYLAEQHETEFGVTLTIGGSIVSGTVISGRKFIDGSVERMTSGHEVKEGTIASEFQSFRNLYMYPDEIDLANFKPRYIHLRDARYFSGPNHPIPAEGMLWRGKLSSVDGFSLGLFNVA